MSIATEAKVAELATLVEKLTQRVDELERAKRVEQGTEWEPPRQTLKANQGKRNG